MRTSICVVGWVASLVFLTLAVAACAFTRQSQNSFYNPASQRKCLDRHPLHSSFGSNENKPSSSSTSSTCLNNMAPKQQEAVAAVPVWFQHEVKITDYRRYSKSHRCRSVQNQYWNVQSLHPSKSVGKHPDFCLYGIPALNRLNYNKSLANYNGVPCPF
jgi:hypothetical protein